MNRLRLLCLTGLWTTFPMLTLAAGIGIGSINGTYTNLDGSGPVHGYIAIVDAMDGRLRPLASEPDPVHCGGEPLLRRETTLEWQQSVHAILAFNGGFWYMPSQQPVPDCQTPTRPYKSAGLSLDASGDLPPSPVLALAAGKAPVIGYADRVDPMLFDVLISGDWIRNTDRQTVHRSLLLEDGRANSSTARDPRTAVGVDPKSGRLIVVMIEGRRRDSQGLSPSAIAHLMQACGAVDAMNLDGGGSSTFSYMPPTWSGEQLVIEQLPLAAICDKDALSRNGLALTIEQQPLDRPLRSQAPGGKGARVDGFSAGYRPVLSNVGFGIGGAAPAPMADSPASHDAHNGAPPRGQH